MRLSAVKIFESFLERLVSLIVRPALTSLISKTLGDKAMKTIIASALILIASTASADWEAAWEAAWATDELMINHEGYGSSQSNTFDPIARSAFGEGNNELFAGHESDGIDNPVNRTAFGSLNNMLYENGI
jgi:hypothetical protein